MAKKKELDPEEEAELKAEKSFERWFGHSTGYSYLEEEDR